MVAIEHWNKRILGLTYHQRREISVCGKEKFISDLTKVYETSHFNSRDGGDTWYPPPQACRFLKLKHHLHSSYEKSALLHDSLSKYI